MRGYLPIQWKTTAYGSATWRRPPPAFGVLLLAASLLIAFGTEWQKQGYAQNWGERVFALKNDTTTIRQGIEESKAELLTALRAGVPVYAADPSLENDLAAAVDRLARDALAGLVAAQSVLKSKNPSNVADYLATRREQLDRGGKAPNERIDEEEIALDREFAAVAFAMRQNDEAERVLDRIITRYPDDLDAINRLGHIHLLRGSPADAEANYRRVPNLALDHELWHAASYTNLGLLMLARGDVDEAEAMHRQALKINEKLGWLKGMAKNFGNLGSVMRTRGNLVEAEAMFRKALQINEKLGWLEGMASNCDKRKLYSSNIDTGTNIGERSRT